MCGSGSMLVAVYCSLLPRPYTTLCSPAPILLPYTATLYCSLYYYPILLSMLRGPGRPEDQQCFMLPIRPPTYISTYFPLQLHVIMYHALLYPQVGELETLQRHKASVILAPPISFVTWEMIDLHHHLFSN